MLPVGGVRAVGWGGGGTHLDVMLGDSGAARRLPWQGKDMSETVQQELQLLFLCGSQWCFGEIHIDRWTF